MCSVGFAYIVVLLLRAVNSCSTYIIHAVVLTFVQCVLPYLTEPSSCTIAVACTRVSYSVRASLAAALLPACSAAVMQPPAGVPSTNFWYSTSTEGN
jgi:hypothetical protein